jgi:hypothetical protein
LAGNLKSRDLTNAPFDHKPSPPAQQQAQKLNASDEQDTTVAKPNLHVDGVQLEGSQVGGSDDMEEVCNGS